MLNIIAFLTSNKPFTWYHWNFVYLYLQVSLNLNRWTWKQQGDGLQPGCEEDVELGARERGEPFNEAVLKQFEDQGCPSQRRVSANGRSGAVDRKAHTPESRQ